MDYYGDEEEFEGEDFDEDSWNAQKELSAANMRLYQNLQHAVRPSLSSVIDLCIRVALHSQTTLQLVELMSLCILLNFISCLRFLPRYAMPLSSTIFGLSFIFRWMSVYSAFYVAVFALLAYLILFYSTKFRRHDGSSITGLVIAGYCIFYCVILQVFFLDSRAFVKIRGCLMVLAMKIISLAIDCSQSSYVPSLTDYASYCFNIMTINFGPWYNFNTHLRMMEPKKFRESFLSILKGFAFLLIGFIFLIISSCLLDWLILDEYVYYSKTIIGYKEAASFRFSHYFVSFVAQAALFFSGNSLNPILSNFSFPNDGKDKKVEQKRSLSIEVSDPRAIELPRSLTEVVINWNIPMHHWLKYYVFRPALRFGTFPAIIATYVASSALHAFNLQLSVVLLSLGFYTYGEYVLREKLAKSFDSCVGAKSCSSCQHKYNWANPCVFITNIAFSLLAIYHLIYLGMLFDSSSLQEEGYSLKHTVAKWNEFSFSSSYVAIGTLVFALII